jgi:hypothetical protein
MTKEKFLSNPVARYFGMEPFPDIPGEWFREAWDFIVFRFALRPR